MIGIQNYKRVLELIVDNTY